MRTLTLILYENGDVQAVQGGDFTPEQIVYACQAVVFALVKELTKTPLDSNGHQDA